MQIRRIGKASLILWYIAFAGTAAAQNLEYPLQVGNQWIYRDAGVGAEITWTVEAVATDDFDGRQYIRLEGFPWGTLWLRQEPDGKMFQWNPERKGESLWVDFGAPDNVEFPSAADPCSPYARIVSREARYAGPIGEFPAAWLLRYGPYLCADAGILEEYYLPSLGLIRRTYQTIAGPRSLDLIYARLGERIRVAEPFVGFSLALDRSAYFQLPEGTRLSRAEYPVMTARLTVNNGHADPILLHFPTAQLYDLVLRNEAGDIVYRWSDGRSFTQAEQTLEVARGEKNFALTVRLVTGSGIDEQVLEPGLYLAEAWLTTGEFAGYRASVPFEIREYRTQSRPMGSGRKY